MLCQNSASQMVSWFLLWLLLCWRASPCEFYLSHQISLLETGSKYSWDVQCDYLVAEKMGPVGKHSICFPAILLLAARFSCATSSPFPLESLPHPFPLESLSHYVASKQLQGFQDSLNCSYSQDEGRDPSCRPFPATVHRDLAPWIP